MINITCAVQNLDKKNSEIIVRSAQKQKDRDYYIDVVEIEINGEKCLVDAMDIQDAIEKCSRSRGRRGAYHRNYMPVRENPSLEENEEE